MTTRRLDNDKKRISLRLRTVITLQIENTDKLIKKYEEDPEVLAFLKSCKHALENNLESKDEEPRIWIDTELVAMLKRLDFDENTSKVASLLIKNPHGLTAYDITNTLEIDRGKVYRILQFFMDKAIVINIPDSPSRYAMVQGVFSLQKLIEENTQKLHTTSEIVSMIIQHSKEMELPHVT